MEAKVHYSVHKSPPLLRNMNQMNLAHTFPPYFLKIRSNILPIMPMFWLYLLIKLFGRHIYLRPMRSVEKTCALGSKCSAMCLWLRHAWRGTVVPCAVLCRCLLCVLLTEVPCLSHVSWRFEQLNLWLHTSITRHWNGLDLCSLLTQTHGRDKVPLSLQLCKGINMHASANPQVLTFFWIFK
jgi:hypothetical protein